MVKKKKKIEGEGRKESEVKRRKGERREEIKDIKKGLKPIFFMSYNIF